MKKWKRDYLLRDDVIPLLEIIIDKLGLEVEIEVEEGLGGVINNYELRKKTKKSTAN